MSELVLTQDQQAAYKEFAAFILDPMQHTFVLEGYAGTGKSTLVQKLLEDTPKILKSVKLINPDAAQEWAIALTATTNKAAEALASIVNAEVQTVQAFLGLRVHKDYETNETKLVARQGAEIPENTIIFVDEASFIDSELLSLIFKRIQSCKVVFIGDPAQLAPIKSKGTPVFEKGYKTVRLTEVMRQAKGNPIMDLATAFRDTVNGQDWPSFTPDDHHIQHLSREMFNAAIAKEFTRPDWRYTDSKVLAWTNKTVIGYNQAIRSLVAGDPELAVGDYAVCNSYIQNQGVRVSTDELVLVTDIQPAIEWDVPGYLVRLNGGSHQFFLPKNPTDKQARIKKARKDDERFLEEMIDKNWIDLRAAYACTINKSQGSTYDQVFIDLDDVKKCNAGNQIARMLYVAVSRAREHVYFTGDLV